MAKLMVATILLSLISASIASNFNVNWVQNPKESLTSWASRMRFQVNDTLAFKSDQANPILVVSKEDYDSCNVNNPIQKLQSTFQLTRSGPFYFISSVAQKCTNGEKLIIVVMSPRNKKQPVISPPASSPPSNISPTPSTISPTPSAMTPTTMTPPATTPSAMTPPATAPSAMTPAATTPSAITPSAMTPAATTPSAITPSAMTPPSMAPSAMTPASMAPSNISPSAASTEISPGPSNEGKSKPSSSVLAASGVTSMIVGVVLMSHVLLG